MTFLRIIAGGTRGFRRIRGNQRIRELQNYRRIPRLHRTPRILLPCLLFLLFPVRVFASDSLDRVLTRADQGIAYAQEGNAVASFVLDALPQWSWNALSDVLLTVDTRLQIVDEQQTLSESTCYAASLFLLESKREEVREKIGEALKNRNVVALIRLQDLFAFLRERSRAFRTGALAPGEEDGNWNTRRLFDKPGQELPGGNKEVCYFDADYTAPSRAGYGCDSASLMELLEEIPNRFSTLRQNVIDEAKLMETLETAAQTLVPSVQGGNLLDGIIDGGAISAPREHEDAEGCMASPPDGVILHASDPLDANELPLLETYWDQESQEREQELSAQTDIGQSAPALAPFFRAREATLGDLGSRQGGVGSRTFALAQDPVLSLAHSFRPFLSSVGTLSHLASDLDGGLRGFVRDFAYFLRRTCLGGTCNKKLDAILKVVLTDSCFPYANGEYVNDTCEFPRWKKCLNDANGVQGPIQPEQC